MLNAEDYRSGRCGHASEFMSRLWDNSSGTSPKGNLEPQDLTELHQTPVEMEGEFCHAIQSGYKWIFFFHGKQGDFPVVCNFAADLNHPFSLKSAGVLFRLRGRETRNTFSSLNAKSVLVLDSLSDIQALSNPPWSHSKSIWIVSVLSFCVGVGVLASFISLLRLRSSLRKMAKTEQELVELNKALEERIRIRTQELQVVNANLEYQIAERKKADEKIAIQQAELLHVSRLSTLGLMSTAISHEINQPLGAISNYSAASLQLIETQGGAALPEIKSHIEEISIQSLRAGQIIKRMRCFGRKTAARRSTCDLNDIVRDSVELLGMELQHRTIRTRVDLYPKPVTFIADRIQIQQLIVNLIANAADSMQDNRPDQRTITLRTSDVGDAVILMVDDQGGGVPAEMIERIFEPFVSSKPEGMGIGLSICEAIAQDHGGRISAENIVPGARFTLQLPKNFLLRQETISSIGTLVTV